MKTRLLKTLLLATLLASVLVATSLPASARIEEVGDELHCLTEDGEDLGQVDADLTEEECLERTPRTRRARLIDRLGEIDQPNVKRKTSRFAIPPGDARAGRTGGSGLVPPPACAQRAGSRHMRQSAASPSPA